MTRSQAARLGGKARAAKADMRQIGKAGGDATKIKYGVAHYAQIGPDGGNATKEAHGMEHYYAIGKRGGAKVRELVARGKRLP